MLPNPQLRELGIQGNLHFNQAEIASQNPTLASEIEAAQQPYVAEQLGHEALADMLSAMPEEQLFSSDDLFKIGRSYLEDAKKVYDDSEGLEPDEMTLEEYELYALRRYHEKRDPENKDTVLSHSVVTTGFVAELARAAAGKQKYAAKQAGQIVVYRHVTSENIVILEAQLPEADRELYASVRPNRDIWRNPIEVGYYRNDPEAGELSDRYAELEIAFMKRWALQGLAHIFGMEEGVDFSREQIEAATSLIGQYGKTIVQ
jgi:hypothetical protein